MKPRQAVTAVTSQFMKDSVPEFAVGDTVRVSVKVVEGARERTQVFEGVVMRRRGGGMKYLPEGGRPSGCVVVLPGRGGYLRNSPLS